MLTIIAIVIGIIFIFSLGGLTGMAVMSAAVMAKQSQHRERK